MNEHHNNYLGFIKRRIKYIDTLKRINYVLKNTTFNSIYKNVESLQTTWASSFRGETKWKCKQTTSGDKIYRCLLLSRNRWFTNGEHNLKPYCLPINYLSFPNNRSSPTSPLRPLDPHLRGSCRGFEYADWKFMVGWTKPQRLIDGWNTRHKDLRSNPIQRLALLSV